MNSKFMLLNKSYKVIEYYQKILINYPKKEIIIKQNIEKCGYDLIESIFAFNINDNERIKQKYLKDYLVNLSMYDYYSKVSYSKKIISKHQYEVLGRMIVELRKIVYGLIKN